MAEWRNESTVGQGLNGLSTSTSKYLRVMVVAVMIGVMVVRMMRIQDADVRFALLQISWRDRLRFQNDRLLLATGRGLIRIDQVRLALVGQTDRQHTEQADDVEQDQLVHFEIDFGRLLDKKF